MPRAGSGTTGASSSTPGLAAGLHRWIGRHPDDGRYVLKNGYDWSYFTVDDAPYPGARRCAWSPSA